MGRHAYNDYLLYVSLLEVGSSVSNVSRYVWCILPGD